MEKFFDIVCRVGGMRPSAVVLVTTVRAIEHHGGVADHLSQDPADARTSVETGMANVRRHLAIVGEFGVPCVVAVNRRPEDTDEELERVCALAREAGAFAVEIHDAFQKGGVGAAKLASAVVDACGQPSNFHQLYPDDAPIREKIETVARRVYGAGKVFFYPEAERNIDDFERDGLGHFPVCMVKTHLSVSADPTQINAPEGYTVPVRDVRAYTGAGWLVALCGAIQQMPSLGRRPAAVNVDIDAEGRIVGLF